MKHSPFGAAAIVAAIALFVASSTAFAVESEPNNSSATADPLGALASGVHETGSIGPTSGGTPDAQDYWTFTNSGGFQYVSIAINWDNISADVDLFLYRDTGGGLVEEDRSVQVLRDTEEVDIILMPGAVYFIEIRAITNHISNYDMWIVASINGSGTLDDVPADSDRLCTSHALNDVDVKTDTVHSVSDPEDWYHFDVSVSGNITLRADWTLGEPAITLTVFRGDGTTALALTPTTSSTSYQLTGFTAYSRYYVRVFSASGSAITNYQLTLTGTANIYIDDCALAKAIVDSCAMTPEAGEAGQGLIGLGFIGLLLTLIALRRRA